jgi:hypothetical protein
MSILGIGLAINWTPRAHGIEEPALTLASPSLTLLGYPPHPGFTEHIPGPHIVGMHCAYCHTFGLDLLVREGF